MLLEKKWDAVQLQFFPKHTAFINSPHPQLIGVTKEGTKELFAVESGFRESKDSWQEVLRDLKRRGLAITPKLAVGDGALGFWGALREEWPSIREQRCWVHKTANVLDKMPKSIQRQRQAARNLAGRDSC